MSVTNTSTEGNGSLVPPICWPDYHGQSHAVQFYAEESPFLGEFSRFIGAALGAGDAAIVAATQVHREEISKKLKAQSLDLASADIQRRHITLDAADTLSMLMVNGSPDPARFSEVMGKVFHQASQSVEREDAGIAVFGEMVALLWLQMNPEVATRLEPP
jgi:hypothetical protein